MNPDSEYFIRELTRKLEEQINSIRRELDNLKRLGLLKAKVKNRKKFYIVNKNFVIFHELKSIILKAMSDKDSIAKKIMEFGKIDVLVLTGLFIDKETSIDLLLVGEIDRRKLEDYLTHELETPRPVKFSIMDRQEFLYRQKCKDKFLTDILDNPDNIVAENRLEKSA